MAEQKKGKYAAIHELRQPHEDSQADEPQATIEAALPPKPPIPHGKRSTPGWKQKSVLLKEESVVQALEILRRRSDRTDFSDLMQALLETWLKSLH